MVAWPGHLLPRSQWYLLVWQSDLIQWTLARRAMRWTRLWIKRSLMHKLKQASLKKVHLSTSNSTTPPTAPLLSLRSKVRVSLMVHSSSQHQVSISHATVRAVATRWWTKSTPRFTWWTSRITASKWSKKRLMTIKVQPRLLLQKQHLQIPLLMSSLRTIGRTLMYWAPILACLHISKTTMIELWCANRTIGMQVPLTTAAIYSPILHLPYQNRKCSLTNRSSVGHQGIQANGTGKSLTTETTLLKHNSIVKKYRQPRRSKRISSAERAPQSATLIPWWKVAALTSPQIWQMTLQSSKRRRSRETANVTCKVRTTCSTTKS